MILSMAFDGWLERLLANRMVVLVGESSFALYMIHHMLFQYIDGFLVTMPRPVALLQ